MRHACLAALLVATISLAVARPAHAEPYEVAYCAPQCEECAEAEGLRRGLAKELRIRRHSLGTRLGD